MKTVNNLNNTTALSPLPSLVQLEKIQRLRIQGYSEEEAERLSKPKETDLEEIMQQIMVWEEKELRRLAKLSPKKKSVKPKRLDDFPDLTKIHISDMDCPETCKLQPDSNL